MIEEGTLTAVASPHGRREWRIRRSDAILAGLEFRHDEMDSIDAVLRRYLSDEMDLMVNRLDRIHEDLRKQLDKVLCQRAAQDRMLTEPPPAPWRNCLSAWLSATPKRLAFCCAGLLTRVRNGLPWHT